MAKLKVMNSTTGLQAREGRADAEARKAMLRDRRIDHAALAELLQQFARDLVGALILRDFLAHDEHALVTAHLFGHGIAQGVAHGRFGEGRAFREWRHPP
jgi:hypothetical protein